MPFNKIKRISNLNQQNEMITLNLAYNEIEAI